ncbi:MAG: 4Fe-4S binding protein, partial [Acidobacteria bacterium]|nr:4Fe-4S binding protein [Acidobacteriota bacterium]
HARQRIADDFLRSAEAGRIRVLHGTVREVTPKEVRIDTATAGQGASPLGGEPVLAPLDELAGGADGEPGGGSTRGLRVPADESLPYDRVYALGGVLKTEVPVPFFRKMGLRFEGEWTPRRWALLALSFILVSAFYLTKKLAPQVLIFGGRDLGGWYPFLYSAVVILFGIRAIRRYRDPLQTQRLAFLIFFQVFFFCILPELILRNWKSYGLAYVWPLVLSPVTVDSYLQPDGRFYFWWTLIASAIGLPLFVIFGGKRYCTYVCGCGGLAETLGDPWRHLAPKGKENSRKERALIWVTWFTVAATLLPLADWVGSRTLGSPLLGGITPKVTLLWDYGVNLALIAIIPIAVYPFLGGKIWCRYWCPVVGFMDWIGRTKRLGGQALSAFRSRFRIDTERERCIACGMCATWRRGCAGGGCGSACSARPRWPTGSTSPRRARR